MSPRSDGLLVRVVLRDAAPMGDVLPLAWRAIATELDKTGAVVERLTIEVVDRIERMGTGTKEKLVSASSA